MTEVDYVVPMQWDHDAELDELTSYLRWLSARARVIVVDGSRDDLFRRHAAAWQGMLSHVRPDPAEPGNGKVAAVTTGMRLARGPAVVIADDDVRYDAAALDETVALLAHADLVGPQNVFTAMPWHAHWDTARSLLNRAFGADYPGTFAIRLATWETIGGYDGNVLFENLELIRTVQAWGGTVRRTRGIYVRRRPPTARHFWSQRIRQAYDDLAQPGRLALEAAVVPAVAWALGRRRGNVLLAGVAGSIAMAEVGRWRDGGRRVFPASASWFAPLWIAERAVCVWAALAQRAVRGGVSYAGGRLRIAAHSPRELRRRAEEQSALARSVAAFAAFDALARRDGRGPAPAAGRPK